MDYCSTTVLLRQSLYHSLKKNLGKIVVFFGWLMTWLHSYQGNTTSEACVSALLAWIAVSPIIVCVTKTTRNGHIKNYKMARHQLRHPKVVPTLPRCLPLPIKARSLLISKKLSDFIEASMISIRQHDMTYVFVTPWGSGSSGSRTSKAALKNLGFYKIKTDLALVGNGNPW